jgi:hypothetical protein
MLLQILSNTGLFEYAKDFSSELVMELITKSLINSKDMFWLV